MIDFERSRARMVLGYRAPRDVTGSRGPLGALGTDVVLKDLSFAVPTGESLALIDPNRSGKTVLFNALIGSAHWGARRWALASMHGPESKRLCGFVR